MTAILKHKSATQSFIEDAIAGGWEQERQRIGIHIDDSGLYWDGSHYRPEEILLDPLAWQAVGKTRGWNLVNVKAASGKFRTEWEYHWHRFIDHLTDGKTIDEALAAISQGV